MMRISYNPKAKKKKGYFLGGDSLFEEGQFTDTGSAMASLGANTIGTVGDVVSAQGPNIAGGALSGAGKGAQMGAALGPWGAAGGALIGGVAGALNSKRLIEDEKKAVERENEATEQRVIEDSQSVLANYDNKGINKGSTFAKGGNMIHYPYQEQDEGNMVAPTIQLAQGGELDPISDTTVEVNGYNPNITDGVELENAFVDDGETIESLAHGGETAVERVYTDKFGLNGKKASRKNPSFATMHKKLQKSKSTSPRHEDFNSLMDKKSNDLFNAQEDVKKKDNAFGRFENGGNITNDPVAKSSKTQAEWEAEMKRRGTITPEEREYTAESARLEAPFIQFEQQREANTQFAGQEGTEATPSQAYTSGELNSWYEDKLGGEVQGKRLQETLGKAASKVGLDPTEFAAAMAQEGWTAEAINSNLNEAGNIDSYGFGLDTVGEYSDVIEKKLGKEYARDTLNLYEGENERKQAITPANFKDVQRMADTAAALYQHRSETVDNTAKNLGIELKPWEKQYFDYMAYNTQHNAPNAVVRGKEKSGEAPNASLKMMMQDLKEKGKLGMSRRAFHKFADVAGDATSTPYGGVESGKGQLFYNAGNAFRRISDLKGAYKPDIPKSIKAPEEATYLPKEGLKDGGNYTDMNTLSAEHMKAGLTLKKKKKKLQLGGVPEKIAPGATQPLEQDLSAVLQGTGEYDPYKQSQIELEQSQYPSLEETVAEQSQNLATGRADFDPAGQLSLGMLASAPIMAATNVGKTAATSAATGSVGNTGKGIVRHAIQHGIKGVGKKVGSAGHEFSYADGGILGNEDYEANAKRFRIPPLEAEGIEIKNMGLTEPANPLVQMGSKINKTKTSSDPGVERKQFDAQDIGDALGTYGPDIAGMFTRLPSAPTSSKVGRTRLEETDNKEELDKISRSYRGAVRGLEGSAQEGAVEATKASLFAKKLQAENVSFDKLNKLNAQTRNRQAAINAQERATDTKIENIDKQNELSRKLKEKEIRRDSLTNLSTKFMASRSEDKMRDLDLKKAELISSSFKGSGVYDRLTPEEKAAVGLKYGGLMRKSRKRKAA